MNNQLKQIGIKYGTDKVDHGYMDIYASCFEKFKDKEINILEIGVYYGASIFTWREYFPKAHIIGIDVEDKSSIFSQLEGSNSFYVADQGNRLDLEWICSEVKNKTQRGFDIVIDDGSHFQHDMMVSFGKIFPHMNKGAVYIIEDMCQAKDLATGSRWWGSPDENHHHSNLPGIKQSINQIKNWLPNGEKDLYHCAERTMERFEITKKFNNAFLTADECGYITNNTKDIKFWKAANPPLSKSCLSSIAVVEHN